MATSYRKKATKKTASKKTAKKAAPKKAAKKTAAKKTASKRPLQDTAPVAAATASNEGDGGGAATAETSSGSSDSEEESAGDAEDDLSDMSEETGPSELEISRRLSADLDATADIDDEDERPADLASAPASGAPLDDDVLSRLGDDDDDLD